MTNRTAISDPPSQVVFTPKQMGSRTVVARIYAAAGWRLWRDRMVCFIAAFVSMCAYQKLNGQRMIPDDFLLTKMVPLFSTSHLKTSKGFSARTVLPSFGSSATSRIRQRKMQKEWMHRDIFDSKEWWGIRGPEWIFLHLTAPGYRVEPEVHLLKHKTSVPPHVTNCTFAPQLPASIEETLSFTLP